MLICLWYNQNWPMKNNFEIIETEFLKINRKQM